MYGQKDLGDKTDKLIKDYKRRWQDLIRAINDGHKLSMVINEHREMNNTQLERQIKSTIKPVT